MLTEILTRLGVLNGAFGYPPTLHRADAGARQPRMELS